MSTNDDVIAVVTGGNRGIGFEIVHQSQGADTAVWLALDAPQHLTGKFIRDREVIPW